MAGDVLIAFLGSGVLTCVLSDKTFAGEWGEEKSFNFSTISTLKFALVSACPGKLVVKNHCLPFITQEHKPHL